jgi:hypothetical protein
MYFLAEHSLPPPSCHHCHQEKGTRMKDLVCLILRQLSSALSFGKLASGKQRFMEAPVKEHQTLQFNWCAKACIAFKEF